MPRTDPLAPLRSTLTTFLDRVCKDAGEHGVNAPTKGPRHPYIRIINREAERLLRAFKDSTREQVRQLPGRPQKGAVVAAVRSVTPKIAKALKV